MRRLSLANLLIEKLQKQLSAAERVVSAVKLYQGALGSVQHTYNCGAGYTCGAVAIEDAIKAYDEAKGKI